MGEKQDTFMFQVVHRLPHTYKEIQSVLFLANLLVEPYETATSVG